jgi:hypothetical protein
MFFDPEIADKMTAHQGDKIESKPLVLLDSMILMAPKNPVTRIAHEHCVGLAHVLIFIASSFPT